MTTVVPCWRARPTQQVQDVLAVERVERTRRFVGEEDLGMVDEATGEGDTLSLATGQLSGAAPLEPRESPGPPEFENPVTRLRRSHADSLRSSRHL
jgi:hypothetical protein